MTSMRGDTPASTPQSVDAAPRVRVSLFVYMILAAIVIYSASAGPAIYVAVIARRNVAQGEWIDRAYFTIFRPHLDLCYRRQSYYEYLRWFIVKAGGNWESHEKFKAFWEVEAGYRKVPAP
jgi:hypothetical protein